eukprot:9493501-Pyramimonas_sp.AAC.1
MAERSGGKRGKKEPSSCPSWTPSSHPPSHPSSPLTSGALGSARQGSIHFCSRSSSRCRRGTALAGLVQACAGSG